MRDRENLRQMIKELGFGTLEDQLMVYARPSIRVYTQRVEDEISIPVGRSKIGGRPDLPPDFDWPVTSYTPHVSLPFIAQFRLEDLKPFDEEDLLPERGILAFFGDPPYARDEGCVLFFDDGQLLIRKEFPADIEITPEDEWGERYTPCTVNFVPEVNLPLESRTGIEYPEGKTWEDFYTLYHMANYIEPRPLHTRVVNRLLGFAFGVPLDLRVDCQLAADTGNPYSTSKEARQNAESHKADWQLLLQMDSDENVGMMWSDAGVICFYVRLEDLKRRKFDDVCVAFFSS